MGHHAHLNLETTDLEQYQSCEIWASHGKDYKDYSFLEYSAVQSRWSRPKF
jgi:hypothetical protein